MELARGLEPLTCCLQDSCATDCATPASRLFALVGSPLAAEDKPTSRAHSLRCVAPVCAINLAAPSTLSDATVPIRCPWSGRNDGACQETPRQDGAGAVGIHSPASSAACTASCGAATGSISTAERADVRAGSGQRMPTMSRSTANSTMVEHRSRDSDREPGGSR
jgi:hypothetical protein